MSRLIFETMVIFLVAAFLLALFGSSSLVTWSYDLPPGALSDEIVRLAEQWDTLMEKAGLRDFMSNLRDWFGETTGAF